MPKKVFNAFESTFEKNFNSKIEKVNWTKEKDQKYFHLEMKFSNKQQSTFAFIKLEKQQLRPEFVSYWTNGKSKEHDIHYIYIRSRRMQLLFYWWPDMYIFFIAKEIIQNLNQWDERSQGQEP